VALPYLLQFYHFSIQDLELKLVIRLASHCDTLQGCVVYISNFKTNSGVLCLRYSSVYKRSCIMAGRLYGDKGYAYLLIAITRHDSYLVIT
jgi:hypothetical protein